MVRIQFIRKRDIVGVVGLHRMILNDGISAILGDKFLTVFYNNLIDGELGICLVAKDGFKIIGWVVGLKQGSLWKLGSRQLEKRNWEFFWEIFLYLTKNLGYFKDFILKRQEQSKNMELYFIGVLKSEQGKGVGTKLIRRFNKEILKKGETGYFLATWNKKAEKFYLKEGLIKLSETIYFGKRTSFMWKGLLNTVIAILLILSIV